MKFKGNVSEKDRMWQRDEKFNISCKTKTYSDAVIEIEPYYKNYIYNLVYYLNLFPI